MGSKTLFNAVFIRPEQVVRFFAVYPGRQRYSPFVQPTADHQQLFLHLTAVIQALDEQKKFKPGAREAIKYFEQEFKKGNRYVMYQKRATAFHPDIFKKSLIHDLVFLSDGFELKKKANLRLVRESVQNKKRCPSGEFVVRHNRLNGCIKLLITFSITVL